MKEINEAYNVLSDDEKRKQYDEKLREKRELAKEKIQENTEQMQNNFNASNTENMSESERRFRDMQRRRYEENLKKEQLKMKQNMQAQYQNAYYNYLRSLGYKIKEKWTWKKTKKLIMILAILFAIIGVLWMIPQTHEIMLNIYNNNFIVKIIADIVIGIFTAIYKSVVIFFQTLFK